MGSECEAAKDEIKTRLAYRNGFLCVVAERWCPEGPQPKTVKLWYPVREEEESETGSLTGRSVAEIDPKEGIYVDEEGTVFQLAEKGETKPIAVEETPRESGELEQLLAASLKNGNSSEKARTHALQRSTGRRKKSGSLFLPTKAESPFSKCEAWLIPPAVIFRFLVRRRKLRFQVRLRTAPTQMVLRRFVSLWQH